MGTIVIDTEVIASAAKSNYEAFALLIEIEKRKNVLLGVDSDYIILKEYRTHIESHKSNDLIRIWFKKIYNRLYFKSLTQRGPYPDTNMSEVDKACLDRAAISDTKILVSEDSDFYSDKTLSAPHPEVQRRKVKLLKIREAAREIENLEDP